MRPALVLSVDEFNDGPAEMVIVAPITRTNRHIRAHIKISPPAGGVKETSFVMTEQIRAVSKDRFDNLMGTVDSKVMAEVGFAVSVLLGI